MIVEAIDMLSRERLLVEQYITDEHFLILVIVIVIALVAIGWLSRKRLTRLKARCARETRFVGFIVVFITLLLFIWCLQWFWKTPNYCGAARDLTKYEYLTGANVVGPGCEELVGRIVKVGKEKYATIGVEDVQTLGEQQTIVSLPVRDDLSLGAGLVVGLCVDVWKSQQKVASGARVATFISLIPDRKLVFLEVTKSEDVKNLTGVAESFSSGTADAANKVTIVGSACSEKDNPQTMPSATPPTPAAPQNPIRTNADANGPSGRPRK